MHMQDYTVSITLSVTASSPAGAAHLALEDLRDESLDSWNFCVTSAQSIDYVNHPNDPNLRPFRVVYENEPGDGQLLYDCWAEDEAHAHEQVRNEYLEEPRLAVVAALEAFEGLPETEEEDDEIPAPTWLDAYFTRRISLILSRGVDAAWAANWIDGILREVVADGSVTAQVAANPRATAIEGTLASRFERALADRLHMGGCRIARFFLIVDNDQHYAALRDLVYDIIHDSVTR